MKADKLVIGNIVTLDPRYSVMEAMTIKDGLVQYVGSLAMAKKLCDENTEIMDYSNNYVYPGFIEAHMHGILAGPRLAFFADLTQGNSMAEYLEILKKYMEEHPDNPFYYGAGWGEKDKIPTAADLDAICPDKPMVLNSFDGHSIWMNTKGMEKFGVDKEAAAYWGTDIIRIYEDGTPTGYISEGPVNEITTQMNIMDMEEIKKAMLVWQERALSLGFTSYYEAGSIEYTLKVYKELIDEGKWKIRVYTGILIDEHEEDYVEKVRWAKEMADKYNCEYLQVIGVKIFMDGVVEAHTAWMIDSYKDKPDYYGVKRFCDYDRVVELFKEASRLGMNVHCHTVGDAAVKFALDCIETAQIETGNMNMRNALAHLQVLRREDIRRLCDLNVVAVVAPLWMARVDGFYDQSIDYIGEKRTFYSYPMESFLKHSGILAFHSDFPVSSEMSFQKSIFMACERNMPENKEEAFYQWNANECISREDALAGITVGPAYAVGQENHLGTLRCGSVANMTVFDKNFLKDDINTIPDSKLIATVIDGEEVYRG